jgi:hypothetical protein
MPGNSRDSRRLAGRFLLHRRDGLSHADAAIKRAATEFKTDIRNLIAVRRWAVAYGALAPAQECAGANATDRPEPLQRSMDGRQSPLPKQPTSLLSVGLSTCTAKIVVDWERVDPERISF